PLTHPVAVDPAFVVDRVERTLEDGIELDGMRGRDLGHPGRRHELEVEPLVAEEPFVAGDEDGQVVYRVHDRDLGLGSGLGRHRTSFVLRYGLALPAVKPRESAPIQGASPTRPRPLSSPPRAPSLPAIDHRSRCSSTPPAW